MNTIFKFTFTHGIELLIAALLLSFIVIYICYWLGDKQQRRDYEKDYNYLKFLVDNYNPERMYVSKYSHDSGNDTSLKDEIKKRFDEISTYSCKNYEKLQVLEKAFIQKFKTK